MSSNQIYLHLQTNHIFQRHIRNSYHRPMIFVLFRLQIKYYLPKHSSVYVIMIGQCTYVYIILKTAFSTDLAYRKSGSLVSNYAVCEMPFLLKSSKQSTSVDRYGKEQNSGYPKW